MGDCITDLEREVSWVGFYLGKRLPLGSELLYSRAIWEAWLG